MRSATATLHQPTQTEWELSDFADGWQRFVIRNVWVHRLRETATYAWWEIWK